MKLSIKNTEVFYHSNQVTVYLSCCPNLQWFENQFTCLDARFIKKTISKYLSTVVDARIETLENTFELIPSQPTFSTPVREYGYYDEFVVRGTATLRSGDVFDREFGRMLAESRAKTQAYEIMRNICRDLAAKYQRTIDELNDCKTHMENMKDYEKRHRDNIINKKYKDDRVD